MKLEKIDKKEEGKFITRYDITYKTVDDTTKIYEMISRNRNVQTREELRGNKPDASPPTDSSMIAILSSFVVSFISKLLIIIPPVIPVNSA